MNFFRINCIALFITVVGQYALLAQDSIPISLNDAVASALQKNTDIISAEYGVQSSEFALKEAKGNFLPKLMLAANYNRNIDRQVLFLPEAFGGGGGPAELGFANDYQSSLNLSVPIYANANFVNKRLAETRLDSQNEMTRGTRLLIANAVKKAYFNFLIAQEVVNTQQSRLANAEQTVTDIEKRLRQGTLTDYDLTSAKVQVATAKNSLLEARSNLVPFENMLKLLTGIDDGATLKLTEPIELIEEELVLDEDVSKIIQRNSRLKQLEIDVALNQEQVKMAKSPFYPTLDAIGNYNYVAQADDFRISEYDWINTSLVGLQLRFTIFNGTVTKNKVEQAKIGKKIAEEVKRHTTKEYRMQHKELLSKLEFSKQKVAVQKENMELTLEALVLVNKRYRFGVGTFLEVNDAELANTQARLGWLQAISDYKAAYYDYRLLIGEE